MILTENVSNLSDIKMTNLKDFCFFVVIIMVIKLATFTYTMSRMFFKMTLLNL